LEDVDLFSLEGKAAIVTGGAGGIGRAIVRTFARAGASVACVDLDAGRAEAAARDGGGRCIGIACDVSSEPDTRNAVEKTVRAFGRLDILVNGAACMEPNATVTDLDLAAWNRIFGVNVGGAFLMSRWSIPHMAKGGGGSIIHIASQLGSVGSPGRAVYCATKGALINMAKAMAADHAGQNIRVNTLSPGGTETDRMMRFGSMERAREVLGARHLMQRLGLPEEIAAGALFLAADASSFMTGADLLIDGGYNAV